MPSSMSHRIFKKIVSRRLNLGRKKHSSTQKIALEKLREYISKFEAVVEEIPRNSLGKDQPSRFIIVFPKECFGRDFSKQDVGALYYMGYVLRFE